MEAHTIRVVDPSNVEETFCAGMALVSPISKSDMMIVPTVPRHDFAGDINAPPHPTVVARLVIPTADALALAETIQSVEARHREASANIFTSEQGGRA